MKQIKRREFIQFAGAALTTLGISQLEIKKKGIKYAKAIAQNTPRKLALLVGINAYEKSPLAGCITDIYLQKELLLHRFGFKDQDILMVTDESEIKPTREGILQAFEEHLIKQAKPGDIAVFHFSGHGSRVVDLNSGFEDQLNSTFVPINRRENQEGEKRTVSDIMGGTLFLLMSAIATENFTAVLDSCHSGGGKRGNFKIRAITGENDYPSSEELAYQKQWLEKLGMNETEYIEQRKKEVAKGVVIASAKREQYAADVPFDGFHAGAFTYVMTQYLWQETNSRGVEEEIENIAIKTTEISSNEQIPEYEAKQGNEKQPIYFISGGKIPAEAVITEIKNNSPKIWLGGIPPAAFSAFGKGAVFAIIDKAGKNQGLVQLETREGITGIGKIIETQQPLLPGMLLQEQARVIPENINLRIGLDESLRDETPKAVTAIKELKKIEPILLLTEQQVEYILGRMTEKLAQQIENPPEVGSFGLYTPAMEIVPASFGVKEETIETALTRLTPKFRSLLATHLVKLMLNTDSSKLKITATMKTEGEDFVAEKTPIRGGIIQNQDGLTPPAGNVRKENGVPVIPKGTNVQFEIKNQEDKQLYVSVLVIDPEGTMTVIFPNTWSENAALIGAGNTKIIPEPGKDPWKLTVGQPFGTVEVLVIASLSPLVDALKALQTIATNRGVGERVPTELGEEATTAVENLLNDLDRESRSIKVEYDPGVRAIATSGLAAMSITFKAVAA